MKITITLLCLSFATFTFAEDEPGKALGSNTLSQAITSSIWTWEHAAGGTRKVEHVQFYQGGLTENSKHWTGEWKILRPRVLEIENTKRGARQFGNTALLVFDADFTQFNGFDFNGHTTVTGFRREALDPARERPKDIEEK